MLWSRGRNDWEFDKEEAYGRYEAAFDELGVDGQKPLIIAPGAMRKLGPPVIRGRAVATKGSTRG